MNIVPASQNSLSAAVELLKKNNLPTEDINPGTQLFVIEENDSVIGTIAVEYNFDVALLRSLSVCEQKRNSGIGQMLVAFIENYVQKQGVQSIYLLTTTAEAFFLKKGYESVDRNEVPDFIKNTKEFSIICSASSTLMKKEL
jgi:amino-acid N-acetyltransferase